MSSEREHARAPFSRLPGPRGVVRDLRTPTFGDLLRRFRRAAGLTQEQLAERASLSVAGISALERGARSSPQRETVRLLSEALGLTPEDRRRLEAAIVARRAPNVAAVVDHRLSGFLSVATDTLIGREDEVRAARGLLGNESTRLLTLTGPGGVGKTRLALEVASRCLGQYPDGVRLLALDTVGATADVLPLLAQRLGIGDRQRGPLLETVISFLQERRVLLLLDNLEHLLRLRDVIEHILQSCPTTQVLATSRAPLNAPWEIRVPVTPLAVPSAETGRSNVPAIADVPSVTLFVRRGQAVRPDFELTDTNVATVAEICRRLEGIPLALELAAMRLRLLSPAQLLARLDEHLPLLNSAVGLFTERHRTLRNTIAWSYELLTPLEQRTFRALAVFAGGSTVEAVEAVCQGFAEHPIRAPAEHEDAWLPALETPQTILAALEGLVDQSLISVTAANADDVPRLTMLEMIREFAWTLLNERGEAAEMQLRHRCYFRALAEAPPNDGSSPTIWLDRLEQEYANLRAALRSALAAAGTDPTAAEDGLTILIALKPLWEVRGYGVEGRRWAEDWIDKTATVCLAPSLRTGALLLAGELALRQGDLEGAEERLQQAIERARAMDERGQLARALCRLGELHRFRGQREPALSCLRESLALARAIEDRATTSDALIMLGIVATNDSATDEAVEYLSEAVTLSRAAEDLPMLARALLALATPVSDQGKMEEMRRLNEEALSLFRQLGDRRGAGIAMGNLGHYFMTLRQYEQAEVILTECLAIRRQLHDLAGVAHVTLVLGTVANRQQRLADAESWFKEGVAAARKADDRRLIASGLDGLASVLRQRGDLVAARQRHAECLQMTMATGIYRRVSGLLEGAALTEMDAGNWRSAVRLFAAAAVERDRLGQLRDTGDFQARVVEAMTQARTTLGDSDFDLAWAQGAAITPIEAIARQLAAYERMGVLVRSQPGRLRPSDGLGPARD